jgi:hypothetical protein
MWVFCFCGPDAAAGIEARPEQEPMNATLTEPAGRPEISDRFNWNADPPAPFRGTDETELERLKNRLLRIFLGAVAAPELIPLFRRAANEAAALAWLEPHPLLVFPTLFEEKLAAARKRNHRQGLVRSRSLAWMEVAT